MTMQARRFQCFRGQQSLVFYLSAMFCILATGAIANAQSKVTGKEWGVAINFAGRQRMLTQKMTKEFLLASLKVDEEASKKLFHETSDLFNETLTRLLGGDAELSVPAPPTQEIRDQLNVVKELWVAFKAKVDGELQGGAPSQAALAEVARLNLSLLQEMNKAVGMYQAESQRAGVKTLGAVINVAGRQRMLSQKMAKEILFVAAGVDPAANQKNLQETKELFQSSLTGLVQGNAELGLPPTTSKPILTQMKKVESLWTEFSPLVDEACSSASISPALIKRAAELNVQILREMNRAVTLYEAETEL